MNFAFKLKYFINLPFDLSGKRDFIFLHDQRCTLDSEKHRVLNYSLFIIMLCYYEGLGWK